MTKLKKAISAMTSKDGTSIKPNKLKRISVSVDYTDMSSFEILGWQNTQSSKTFSIKIPMKYYEEIVVEITSLSYEKEDVVDIFEDKKEEIEKETKGW